MANNLRELRKSKKWTQEQAAAAIGTTRNQYLKLENGARRLSGPWIDRAATAFGLDAADIVRGSGTADPVVGRITGDGSIAWTNGEPQVGVRETTLVVEAALFSALLAYGDQVNFRHERRPIKPEDDGRLGIVGTQNVLMIGRVFIKGLSDGDGLVVGANSVPLRLGKVAWLSPILSIKLG